jgi:hypothetical protein
VPRSVVRSRPRCPVLPCQLAESTRWQRTCSRKPYVVRRAVLRAWARCRCVARAERSFGSVRGFTSAPGAVHGTLDRLVCAGRQAHAQREPRLSVTRLSGLSALLGTERETADARPRVEHDCGDATVKWAWACTSPSASSSAWGSNLEKQSGRWWHVRALHTARRARVARSR